VAETPGPKGTVGDASAAKPRACCPRSTRRRAGSYGALSRLSYRNWGTLTPLHPARGRENASVRERGRRRRNSPTPSCNGTDMAKVRQERETCERESTSVVRVSRRHNGSPLVTTARVPARARCAGRPEPGNRSGKRSAVKVARSVWDGGTAVKPNLSLPFMPRNRASRSGDRPGRGGL